MDRAVMLAEFEALKKVVESYGCNDCYGCKRCYYCNDCEDCYGCNYCYDCEDCYGCNYCALCVGLVGKMSGFWLLNKEVTELEFNSALDALRNKGE